MLQCVPARLLDTMQRATIHGVQDARMIARTVVHMLCDDQTRMRRCEWCIGCAHARNMHACARADVWTHIGCVWEHRNRNRALQCAKDGVQRYVAVTNRI